MKRSKGVISILLCLLLVLQSACGKAEEIQGTTDSDEDRTEISNGFETGETESIPEEEPQLLHSDWLERVGEVTQTWQKDYTSTEWEDGVCLTMYVVDMEYDDLCEWIDDIEEELNHRLYQAGYGFYLHFEQPSFEETHSMTPDELVADRQQSGMTIDLYKTYDYQAAVDNGLVLDMTDYLQSEEGRDLYEHFDSGVWQQMEMGNGRIYGFPANPVAATRCVYAYSPQLMDVLGIDMSSFDGDISIFETAFPEMLAQGIAPITYACWYDLLGFSLIGLEKYKEIFAVRHTGDTWEAVDFFEEEDAMSFYEQLGDWREKGFLFYDQGYLSQSLGRGVVIGPELNSFARFDYRFLEMYDINKISWSHDVNVTTEDGFVETAYYVPQGQIFITENRNSQIFVVNADTQYPQECMQFLNLLSTDDEIRMLLYKGIEGCHYVWQDDVLIRDDSRRHGFAAHILGFMYDLSFWPSGHWGEKYATEIEEMNRDVSEGISLTVDCDFAGLEEQYEACCQLFAENILVFLGYYGAETGERLQALHEQLNEAGYQELIAAVNAMHE